MLAAAWRRWGLLVVTAAAVALADVTAAALKGLIDVQRPSTRFAEPKPLVAAPHDHSFPSGHAATSFAAATVLAAAVPRAAAAWYLLAAAIAFSRVYVGVHYPLDVVAGALLGFGIAKALLRLSAGRLRSRAPTPRG